MPQTFGSHKKSAVFEKTYQDYLSRMQGLDLSKPAERLGLEVSEDHLLIPFLGSVYRVSKTGIINPEGKQARFTECVVLFKYILMCPKNVPAGSDWVTYHSFKDAQPLIGYFARETSRPIEKCFAGKLEDLKKAGKKLGGSVSADGGTYDLSLLFEALPKIPLFLRFNDQDDEFPAQSTVLFQFSAAWYLDMESLAILGTLFTERLTAQYSG